VEEREKRDRAMQLAVHLKLVVATVHLMQEALHGKKLRGALPEAASAVVHIQRFMRGCIARIRVRHLRRLKRVAGGMIFKFREWVRGVVEVPSPDSCDSFQTHVAYV
jgi:hypothetical protein